MKVALFSSRSYDKEYFEFSNVNKVHNITYFETSLDETTTNLTLGFDAVCVFVNDKLNRKTIEQLHQNGIKIIALRCAGFNNVDLEAADQMNIKVVRVPSYSPNAVAEHATALILTLNRKTHKAFNRIKEDNFSLERLMGFDIYGKTVGVIGTGKIGYIFCKIMLGFGCNVIAYDIQKSEELIKQGIKYSTLDDLLSTSDIVSLHCPLTPQTFHMLNVTSLEKMKKGSMLINTSRGGLINTKDVIKALKKGHLGYLGIDVYEQEGDLFYKDLSENIIQDDNIVRLMSFPNVMITGHQGFFTKEALTKISITTLDNLTCFANGETLINEVKVN